MGKAFSCQSPVFPILALIGSGVAAGIFAANLNYYNRVRKCQGNGSIPSTCPGSPISYKEANSMWWISLLALLVSVMFFAAFLYQIVVGRQTREAIAKALTTPGGIQYGFEIPRFYGQGAPTAAAIAGAAAAPRPAAFAPPAVRPGGYAIT